MCGPKKDFTGNVYCTEATKAGKDCQYNIVAMEESNAVFIFKGFKILKGHYIL